MFAQGARVVARTATTATAARGVRVLAARAFADKAVAHHQDHSHSTWSSSQALRQDQLKGPRFADVDLQKQPLPKPAIDLLAQEPIHYAEERIVVCDGGHGGLGHPRVYINLDHPTEVADCGYCGKKFARKHHH